MVEIPEDIIRRLADGLDLQSARCLALAGSGVREVGERRIWEVVDLTVPSEEVGGKSSAAGHGMEELCLSFNPDWIPVADAADSREDALCRRLERVHASLLAHPPRASYIKRLRIHLPPSPAAASIHTLGILKLVAPHARGLDLYFPPISADRLADSSTILAENEAFMRHLDETVDLWENVLDLRLTLAGQNSLQTALGVLDKCPRLRTLVLRPLNTFEPSHEPSPASQVPRAVQLPHLLELAIEPILPDVPKGVYHFSLPPEFDAYAYRDVYHRYREIMTHIVPHAPRLRSLTLGGPHPLDEAALKVMLERLPELTSLLLDCRRPVRWTEGSQIETGVEHVILEIPSYILSHTEVKGWETIVKLPVLPSLKTLTIRHSSESSLCAPKQVDVHKNGEMAQHLYDVFGRQPSLEVIHLTSRTTEPRTLVSESSSPTKEPTASDAPRQDCAPSYFSLTREIAQLFPPVASGESASRVHARYGSVAVVDNSIMSAGVKVPAGVADADR